ncbi:MAG: hypothetical protein ACI915_005592 [Gammaproteobacteria bacterium]|jgi:hypothetical protein
MRLYCYALIGGSLILRSDGMRVLGERREYKASDYAMSEMQSPFEDVQYDWTIVQRCTGCQGLWIGQSKHEYLKSLGGSEVIDIGDATVGWKFNKIDRIFCPACNTAMIRMVVPDQHHIWFESCSICEGVFFDAGEFRDYKEKTVLDFFRDLMTEERR